MEQFYLRGHSEDFAPRAFHEDHRMTEKTNPAASDISDDALEGVVGGAYTRKAYQPTTVKPGSEPVPEPEPVPTPISTKPAPSPYPTRKSTKS